MIPKPEQQEEATKTEKSSGGLFGFGKKTELKIGSVTSYVHESHVGVASDGSFDLQNIPSDWKTMFKANGIKKKDLKKNPELANKMLKIMEESGGVPPPTPPKPARL